MDWKIEVIPVPVTDVDRAKAFYSNLPGFAVDHDTRISESMRVVQITPPGSGCSIVIGTGLPGTAPGSIQGVQFVVDDVARAREDLVSRGVDVSPVFHYEGSGRVDGPGGPWNTFATFEDPDGNGWTLQERPTNA
jgi:catechol 2,3-dioxygenase-like lactoylglutathione lyase family enzyme